MMEFTVQLKDASSRVIIERESHLHLKDYINFNCKVMVVSDTQIPLSLKEEVMAQLENATLVEVAVGEVS